MELINQAIIFAARAHEGQKRKATDIPYITHPLAVGMLLQKVNCSNEVIAAGILHDTIEDTSVTYENLHEQFGEKIANLVKAASEQDKSLPWKERKLHTIGALKTATLEEVQVITELPRTGKPNSFRCGMRVRSNKVCLQTYKLFDFLLRTYVSLW